MLSIAFLDGKLDQTLELIPNRKMETVVLGKKKNKYGRPKRKLLGSIGDIIISDGLVPMDVDNTIVGRDMK